jgi:hypothetical protein
MSELSCEPGVLPEEFRLPSAVVVRPNGQVYRLDRVQPHERRDGSMTSLAVWRSACADCGAPFECTEPLGKFPLSRRCHAHRAPGRPVVLRGVARLRSNHRRGEQP